MSFDCDNNKLTIINENEPLKTDTSTTKQQQQSFITFPLEKNWNLYRFWEWDKLMHVYKVTNVPDFWRMYNNMELPTELINFKGCNYAFFQDTYTMKWEDPKIIKYGKWTLCFDSKLCVLTGNNKKDFLVNHLWLNILLLMIGNILPQYNFHGLVVSCRSTINRLTLWVEENDIERLKEQGPLLRKYAKIPNAIKLNFSLHQEASKKNSTYLCDSILYSC